MTKCLENLKDSMRILAEDGNQKKWQICKIIKWFFLIKNFKFNKYIWSAYYMYGQVLGNFKYIFLFLSSQQQAILLICTKVVKPSY